MSRNAMMRWMIGLCLAVGVTACAVEDTQTTSAGTAAPTATAADDGAHTAERPTSAMLAASLTGDPDLMALAMPHPNGACLGATTCDPSFGSCGSWSTPTACNTPVCAASGNSCVFVVQGGPRPVKITYPPLVSGSEQYRVCFNAAGQSCIQRTQTVVTSCSAAQCCPNCTL